MTFYWVAMVREKKGKLDFIQGEGVLYQAREFYVRLPQIILSDVFV